MIAPVQNAKCVLFPETKLKIELSNMGEKAIKSHAKGKKTL